MFDNMTDSVVLFILFLVVANPVVYKMVDQILSTCGLSGYIFESEVPGVSMMAVALHALVFVGVYQLYKTTMVPPEGFTEGEAHDEDPLVDIFEDEEVVEVDEVDEVDPPSEEEIESDEQPGQPEQPEQPEQPGPGPGQPGQGGESQDLGGFEGFSSGGMGSAF